MLVNPKIHTPQSILTVTFKGIFSHFVLYKTERGWT